MTGHIQKIFGNFFLVIVVSALLAACASGPDFSKIPPLPTDVAPVAPVAENLAPYKVQIGDTLDISFYLNPEFNETVTVRPDGMISTKVVDELLVYDRSISEINAALKKLYGKELKDPYVTTVVRSFAPIRIYVSGEVNAPGEYVVVGQALTLTQAIARAGGIKNSGMQDKVLVIRRGAGEKSEVFTADYYGATQDADPAKDARLAADDVVFVPRTGAALTYAGYQQYIQQFVNPTTSVSGGYSIK